MSQSPGPYVTCLAASRADVRAAQALRYEVFVAEMGADGALVDHAAGLEADAFDANAAHILLIDTSLDRVVGTTRLMLREHARRAGRFYSDAEYDLSTLLTNGRTLLEVGRSCLHPAHRGGAGLMHLWQGLAGYVHDHGVEILFGVASFPGVDPVAVAHPLSHLHHAHRAPDALRVRSRAPLAMNQLPADAVDRRRAMLEMPALIKAYLRLGAVVGEGAYLDAAFNTIDVCMVMDTARMVSRQRAIYDRSMAP